MGGRDLKRLGKKSRKEAGASSDDRPSGVLRHEDERHVARKLRKDLPTDPTWCARPRAGRDHGASNRVLVTRRDHRRDRRSLGAERRSV